MNRQVVFETHVSRPGASTWVGVLAAFAICAAVVLGLNLYIGERQLPRELVGSTPWFGVLFVALSGVTGWVWWRSRRRLVLAAIDGVQVLEIDDRPPVLLQGPFTIRTGWTRLPQPKGPDMTLLQVVFYDGERVPLVLTETWGALYGTPGWDEGVVLVEAEASYSPSGLGMVTELVGALDVRD
jgi:hypothetical protein